MLNAHVTSIISRLDQGNANVVYRTRELEKIIAPSAARLSLKTTQTEKLLAINLNLDAY